MEIHYNLGKTVAEEDLREQKKKEMNEHLYDVMFSKYMEMKLHKDENPYLHAVIEKYDIHYKGVMDDLRNQIAQLEKTLNYIEEITMDQASSGDSIRTLSKDRAMVKHELDGLKTKLNRILSEYNHE